MSAELSPAETLAYSTVRIETEIGGGGTATGTGFFYRLAEEGERFIPVIVTNKHVVEGATRGRFKLTLRTSDGKPDRLNHATFILDDSSGSGFHILTESLTCARCLSGHC